MKKYVIIVLVLMQVCTISAQKNPGYLGKKNVISVNAYLFPIGYLNHNILTQMPSLTVERSVFRNTSLCFGFTQYGFHLNQKFLNTTSHENLYYDNRFNTYAFLEGSAKASMTQFYYALRNYIGKYGSIAPMGTFWEINVNRVKWSFNDVNIKAYYLDGGGNRNYYSTESRSSLGSNKLTIIGIGFGSNKVIKGRIVLGYSLGSGLILNTVTGINLGQEMAIPDYISRLMLYSIRSKFTMELKLKIGYLL